MKNTPGAWAARSKCEARIQANHPEGAVTPRRWSWFTGRRDLTELLFGGGSVAQTVTPRMHSGRGDDVNVPRLRVKTNRTYHKKQYKRCVFTFPGDTRILYNNKCNEKSCRVAAIRFRKSLNMIFTERSWTVLDLAVRRSLYCCCAYLFLFCCSGPYASSISCVIGPYAHLKIIRSVWAFLWPSSKWYM